MNETTAKLINWIWSEPELADFLRDVAEGDEFEYGDYDLGCWINDLVFLDDGPLPVPGVDAERIHRLYAELTEGRDKLAWIDEMDVAQIRDALLGNEGGGDTFAHATVTRFHPHNRYRVHDKGIVYEPWETGRGAIELPERDRQVCPVPIETPCTCTVNQKEKKR